MPGVRAYLPQTEWHVHFDRPTRQGKKTLANWPVKDVRFIWVSTGGRILGLGDLGANGMGIPVGKLQLYTACAAVPPEMLLPVLLDCGTDNQQLLDDPLYLGLRQKRPSTEKLDAFVQEFVDAVQELYPKCCIHFKGWKGTDAIRLLARYVDKISCYNDDIQGTGSVTVAGLYNALKINKGALKDRIRSEPIPNFNGFMSGMRRQLPLPSSTMRRLLSSRLR